jgi:hypothetical protein
MNRFLLRRLIQAEFENLLDALSSRQHLNPHEPVTRALDAVGEQLGVCPQAVGHAVAWLQLDGSQSVGRLRRTELMQLARSIYRFWRQRTSAKGPQPTERRP